MSICTTLVHTKWDGTCEEKEEMSQDKFMRLVTSSAKLVDAHYSLRLSLRNENIKILNNHCMAQQRAENLKGKLKKNPDFHEDYILTCLIHPENPLQNLVT